MKIQIFLYTLTLTLILTSCTKDAQDIHDFSKYQVFTIPKTLRENTVLSITAEQHKDFIIKVRGNPTTGYSIRLKNEVSQLTATNVVKATNLNANGGTDDYIVDNHENGMVGVPGFYYFKFRTENEGQETLLFSNERVWDTSDAVELKVNLTVLKSESRN